MCIMICWWMWYLLYMQSCEQVPEIIVPSIANRYIPSIVIRYIPDIYEMYRKSEMTVPSIAMRYTPNEYDRTYMNDRIHVNDRLWNDTTWYVIDMNGCESYKMYGLLHVFIWYMVHVWWWCYSLSGASYKALNFSRLLVESFQVTGLSTQTDRLIAPSSLILFTLHCV